MHLLYLLFVKKMKSEDLLTALHDEYDIDLTAKGKEDVTTMCNLGEGLYERAMEKGIERGVEQEKRNSERKDREAALEMIKDGLSFEQIARYMKLSIEAVAEIAQKNKLIRCISKGLSHDDKPLLRRRAPYVAPLQGIPLESGIPLHPFLTSCILRII